MNHPQQFQRFEDAYPGLLTEQQLVALDRIQKGARKLAEAVSRLNAIKVDARLPLPAIRMTAYETGVLLYAVECLQFEHELAYSKLRQEACAAPLGEAA